MGLSDLVKKVYEKQITEEAEKVAKDLDRDYLNNKDEPVSEEDKELEKRINVIDIDINEDK